MTTQTTRAHDATAGLGWLTIIRLGLVQSALGAIVVLTTSTLNRVMVVELALPATIPGLLVGLHYAVQLARPRFGYGSDSAGRRTPWIVGGMAALCLGGAAAAASTALMAGQPTLGLVVALAAFVVIGFGVGASGTSLLALLAKRVAPARRGAAAAVVWLMMIVGIIITAGVAGALLDPFSIARLLAVSCGVCGLAFVFTLLAIWGVETQAPASSPGPAAAHGSFRRAIADVWADQPARRFTVFVFVSMLAYSMQDLILEPFAGIVFGLSPGQTTQLTGVQHSGVLLGMLLVGGLASGVVLPRIGSLRQWAIVGCGASACALAALAWAAISGPPWPIRGAVFVLGFANGGFAVSAIALMMSLAGERGDNTEGTRVGLWGAAQAMAFGLGGLLGTIGVDTAQHVLGSPTPAYALVFSVQAGLFLVSACLMQGMARPQPSMQRSQAVGTVD